jgi:hypothetical protein
MTSRRLRGCLHAVVFLLPLLRVAAPAVAAPPPNIVFILTDDQRWDTIDATHSLDRRVPPEPARMPPVG